MKKLSLSYRELKKALSELSEDQLDLSVTIFDSHSNETFGITETILMSELSDDEQDEIGLEDEDDIGIPLLRM